MHQVHFIKRINYSPNSKVQILPPNPLCVFKTAYAVTADATQKWWTFCYANEHRDV
jgi:hypothetical protein